MAKSKLRPELASAIEAYKTVVLEQKKNLDSAFNTFDRLRKRRNGFIQKKNQEEEVRQNWNKSAAEWRVTKERVLAAAQMAHGPAHARITAVLNGLNNTEEHYKFQRQFHTIKWLFYGCR